MTITFWNLLKILVSHHFRSANTQNNSQPQNEDTNTGHLQALVALLARYHILSLKVKSAGKFEMW